MIKREEETQKWWILMYLKLKECLRYFVFQGAQLISVYLLPEELEGMTQESWTDRKASKRKKCVMNQQKQNYYNNERLVTVWREHSMREIWVQIYFDLEYNTFWIRSYEAQNYMISSVKSKFIKNLALSAFQNFNTYLSLRKQQFEVIMHPETGVVSVVSRIFMFDEKIKQMLVSQYFLASIISTLDALLGISSSIYKYLLRLQNQQLVQNIPMYSKRNIKTNLEKQKCQTSPYQSDIILNVLQILNNQAQINPPDSLDDLADLQQSNNYVLKNYQQIPKNIEKIFGMLRSNTGEQSSKRAYSSQQIDIIMNAFPEITDNIQEDQNSILKEIKILTNPKLIAWDYISEGGFGTIEKAEVQYTLQNYNNDVENDSPAIKRGYIVRKYDSNNRFKVGHQKHILSLLSNQYYPYIMTHYTSEQQQFEGYLFSKYEPHTSLDNYLEANDKSISLISIVKLLEESMKGLMFLNSQNIVHFDVKPNNIIITKNLRAKIVDFGECICSQYCEKQVMLSYNSNYVRGFTAPYTAPQLLNKNNAWIFSQPYPHIPKQRNLTPEQNQKCYQQLVNEKLDVYSMGITIFKTIFKAHIATNKNHFYSENLDTKEVKACKNNIKYAPQKIDKYGFKRILQLIVNLVFKCISKQQSERPNLFYMSVMLAISHKYLNELTNINQISPDTD